jgi:DNA processing protein
LALKPDTRMRHTLSDSERRAWLRLARTAQVGPVTFAQLIARFSSASQALAELPRLARRGGSRAFEIPDEEEAAREIEATQKIGGRIIASCEPDFPDGLAALTPAPPVISLLGHATLLRREMIAIVGARNASALGRRLASTLARDLADAGLVVISGLARGIDAAAHEAALEGGTIAVVAGGVDNTYPPENAALYESIRARGAIISEMPLGQMPQARHFPRRNRLIAGLARGVIIVEAAERSGSLITANYALEQNREIFAVPGSPLDPRAKGANRLIRDGATLTESAEDILAVLRPMLGHDFREPGPPRADPPPDSAMLEAEADRIRALVEEAIGPSAVEIDELIRLCAAPAAVVLTVILELELAGRLSRQPGNRVCWL